MTPFRPEVFDASIQQSIAQLQVNVGIIFGKFKEKETSELREYQVKQLELMRQAIEQATIMSAEFKRQTAPWD